MFRMLILCSCLWWLILSPSIFTYHIWVAFLQIKHILFLGNAITHIQINVCHLHVDVIHLVFLCSRERPSRPVSESDPEVAERLAVGSTETLANGNKADLQAAKRLAKRLYNLDGFKKSDVARHLSKKWGSF